MRNKKSSDELEKNIHSIKRSKHNLVIGSIIVLVLILTILAILLFSFKKRDLGIQEKKVEDRIVSRTIDQGDSPIKKFTDYEELRDFLESSSSNFSDGAMYGHGELIEADIAMDDESFISRKGSIDSNISMTQMTEDESSEHSETNVQVKGVDEADIIKTDGDYIYAVSKKNLFIIDSKDPKNLNILSKIEFEDQPQNIYLNDDRLIVFGRNNDIRKKEKYSHFKRYSQYTFFKVFDISNRKDPKQLKNYDFEGNYSNSRMIGNYVYFLTNASNINYSDPFPIPRILEGGKEIYSLDEQGCLGGCPDVYYIDDISNQYTMVNVMAINVQDINENDNDSLSHEVYLMPYNQNLYVSHNNLYLTYTKYLNQQEFLTNLSLEIAWNKLSASEQNKINKIKEAEYFILSKNEKMRKIQNVLNRINLSKEEEKELEEKLKNKVKEIYPQIVDKIEETIVHKIAIDGGNLEYKGFGVVPGTVLNQFSMDEKSEYFRIATTRNQNRIYWLRKFDIEISQDQQESYNNLYVLDKDLKITGRLEGLAESERIYSVRFMDDRVYMVTFRQTDPLFVIDLQNPKEPTVLGKLKIPGFSNYLHPYDENHLIGIGKDTEENNFGGAVTKGLKIALFDVSDVENPKEKAKYILGGKGSDSLALRDHKAVLFDKEKNLLVLPVTLQNLMNSNGSRGISFEEDSRIGGNLNQQYFVGAAVLNIDDSNIGLRGLISHSKNSKDNWCLGSCYNDVILRSLWINDALYTFSNSFLQANDISSLNLIKKLELKFSGGDDFRVVN